MQWIALVPLAVWLSLLLKAISVISQHYIGYAWFRSTEPTKVSSSELPMNEPPASWTPTQPGEVRYHRLFVQNLEEVPLAGPAALDIRVTSGSKFLRTPRVFAGPTALVAEIDKEGTVFTLRFNKLPEHGTWVLEWQLDREAEVKIALRPIAHEGDEESASLSRLAQVSQFSIPAKSDNDTVGWQSTPRLRSLVWALLLVVLGYAAIRFATRDILFGLVALQNPSPSTLFAADIDTWFVGLMLVLTLVTYALCRREPIPIVQGYWQPTRVFITDARAAGMPAKVD